MWINWIGWGNSSWVAAYKKIAELSKKPLENQEWVQQVNNNPESWKVQENSKAKVQKVMESNIQKWTKENPAWEIAAQATEIQKNIDKKIIEAAVYSSNWQKNTQSVQTTWNNFDMSV